MPYIPPQGTPGVSNARNPTLIPNFDKPVVTGGGVMASESPATFLAANPRVDALGNALVGGSITNGDTVSLTVSVGTLPNGAATVTYPVVTSDTTTTVAEGIANAINNSGALQSVGVFATMGGTSEGNQVVVHGNGPIGNSVTLAGTVSGSATETLTFGTGTVAVGNATGTAIIAGTTLTAADTVRLTFTNAGVTGLPESVIYTFGTAETVTTIATGLKNLVNADTILAAAAISALSSSGTVTISQPGTIGNTTVITKAITGTGNETVTLSNGGTLTGGTGQPGSVLTGGSGPVFATGNFQFSPLNSGQVQSFFYGQPYVLGPDVLSQMINQGRPIE